MEIQLNQILRIEQQFHQDPEISVFVVDDFLANPEALLAYARERAYFGDVGNDRTAYPGIRDRLPKPYERALGRIIEVVYGDSAAVIHRCMLSLTTLPPESLGPAQKMPHVDAYGDNQFAAVHYLCGPPHGGTAIYRYRQEDCVRVRTEHRHVMGAMVMDVKAQAAEHGGYLTGDTSLFKQEMRIAARFNRLVLYPSNLLHCAILDHPASLSADPDTGRLSVASFFQLDPAAEAVGIGGQPVAD